MAPTFPYTPVSYSTDMPMHVSIGTAAQYGHYDPHDLVQMDHEEEVQLFHGAHYGMSQIARAEPFEQWLNSYWRRFHPTFPVVHRPTFASIGASPLLCAAMCAIGAHHSNDSYNARDLHARCVKLLLKVCTHVACDYSELIMNRGSIQTWLAAIGFVTFRPYSL